MQKPSQNQADQLVGQIVYRDPGFPTFYLIIKETPHTVTLKPLHSIKTMQAPALLYGQRGTQVPAPLAETPPTYNDPKYFLRAKKHEPDYPGDHLWFSYKNSAFFLWDGQPLPFDYM